MSNVIDAGFRRCLSALSRFGAYCHPISHNLQPLFIEGAKVNRGRDLILAFLRLLNTAIFQAFALHEYSTCHKPSCSLPKKNGCLYQGVNSGYLSSHHNIIHFLITYPSSIHSPQASQSHSNSPPLPSSPAAVYSHSPTPVHPLRVPQL